MAQEVPGQGVQSLWCRLSFVHASSCTLRASPGFPEGGLPVARGVGMDGRRCGLGCESGPVGGLVLVGAAPAKGLLDAGWVVPAVDVAKQPPCALLGRPSWVKIGLVAR